MSVDYKCSKCKSEGVKLWRQYNRCADQIELLCLACAYKDQNKTDFDETLKTTDQIGCLVPAVPTDDGSYWGYTSVPQVGVDWWYSLPNRVEQPIGTLMDADEVARLICEIAYRNGWVLMYKLERRK